VSWFLGYILHIPDNELSLLVQLSGPFVAEQSERKINNTEGRRMDVWLERWTLKPDAADVTRLGVTEVEVSGLCLSFYSS
jgi:hypothetical protein